MKSSVFDAWANHVLNVEGGYSDHPDDRGGETWFGFTADFLALTGEPVPKTHADAKSLLLHYFWLHYGCDRMDWFVGWCYGDAAVNHSPKSAARCLQAGLNVRQDGVVGPLTMEAANNVRRTDFWLRYVIRRRKLYFAQVRFDREQLTVTKQMTFLRGWMNRLDELSTAAYQSSSA